MNITHYDLFAGIGGFSIALEEVFDDATIKHIFCEWESFPTSVLRNHWPDGEFYGDIADLVTDTSSQRQQGQGKYKRPKHTKADKIGETNTIASNNTKGFTIVTGGFPCQPFSHAGRRQGTADDRSVGDACTCGKQCSIIGVCNGDTTTSVQDARNGLVGQSIEKASKSTQGFANPVQQSIKRSGEQPTERNVEQRSELGHSNTRTRYSNDMEGNASAVEKPTEHFSQSTTSTEGGTRNGNESTTRHGDSLSRTTTHRTSTKSCATTATTPSIASEPVHTRSRDFTIVTGGFPCQPFSHAGRRKGTADERYQWPNMFNVIKNVKPDWVIAENVRGLVTWNDGLVLETVCADLESEGYEVQPLIIPAVAVGAPHRRDRVWIIANRPDTDSQRERDGLGEVQGKNGEVPERNDHAEPGDTGRQPEESHQHQNAQNPFSQRVERRGESAGQILGGESSEVQDTGPSWPDWNRNWQEVAFSTCDDSMDARFSTFLDGLPVDVYGTMMVYGTQSYTRTNENMPRLQAAFQSPEVREKIRGFYPMASEEILYEIVCQLERGLESSKKLSAENSDYTERSLHSVWCEEIRRQADKRSSQGWRLIEQQARELTDIVPELPYEIALELMEAGYCLWKLYSSLHPKAVADPRLVDGVPYSRAKWRKDSLKAYGNGICPQVAIEIMKAIKQAI